MLLIALHHRERVIRIGQSAWKGGGFAMFSVPNRQIVVRGELWVREDRALRPLRVDGLNPYPISVVPSEKNLQRLCRAILGRQWRRDGVRAVPLTRAASDTTLDVAKVTVTCIRIDFEAATGIYRNSGERQATCDSSGA